MDDWPEIHDEQVRARLGLSDDEMFEFMLRRAAGIPPREFSDEAYAYALGYPWARPETSYVLTGGEVEPIEDVPELGGEPRFPLLAIGSNAAPENLAVKLADMPDGHRDVAVVLGVLHDFDIGPAAAPTVYGSLAATMFPSPGTAVQTALLWVTALQLNAIVAWEVSYYFGRLDGVRFVPDPLGGEAIDSVYAFVHRFGAHCSDGEPVALAAVPATDRSAPAYTQEQLLTRMAELVLGDGATARDVVRRITEDYAGWTDAATPVLRPLARLFESPHFTRYPRVPSG